MTRDEIMIGKMYLVAGSQNPIRVTRHQEGAQTPVVRGVQRLWRRDRWYGVDVITGRTTGSVARPASPARSASAKPAGNGGKCITPWYITAARWW